MKIKWLIALLLSAHIASAQQHPHFSSKAFAEKLEIARWMVAYDSTAWRLSELVTSVSWQELGRMGREWFCYKGAPYSLPCNIAGIFPVSISIRAPAPALWLSARERVITGSMQRN